MSRLLCVPILCVAALCADSAVADWSDALFPVKRHDFGTVAVAAKTEFRFPIQNTTGKPLHIQSVRTSCGCTTAIIETPYVEPGKTGWIVARYNTDTHRGRKGATITVVIDQPFYTEARLRVDGYIRQDMVFHPGSIDFGTQSLGQELTRSAKILYAGRSDWAVVDVLSNKPWMSVDVKQESRSGGNATYLLTVTLAPSAPAGFFQDELIVVTNDRAMPRVPLRVSGELESELTISPQSIAIGSVQPGEVIEKRLVIRGKEPFLIDSIQVKGWQVTFDPVTEPKTTHVVRALFKPDGETSGQLTGRVVVTTSGGISGSATAMLTAIVRNP
jgi:hypothetical protein